MSPLEWLDYEIFGNSLLTWSTSVGVFLGVWMLLGIARRVISGRLRALAEHRKAMPPQIAEHVVGQTKGWFLLLMALFVGSRILALAPSVETLLTRVAIIGLLVQIGLWAAAGLGKFLDLRRERQLAEDPGTVAAMDVLGFVLRLGVWAIVLLLALDNLGVNITTLVAGLGVGGIAVALAAQSILSDLFASLSIVLDRPFVVGDFLIIDDFLGSVEKVGLKTTRVRSLSGEQLIFSNNDLLSSRIRNYGRMFERRVVFSLGVVYQTPGDKLRRIPGIIREAIEAQDKVRFDRAHFQEYGDFALIFEVVYYVLSPDYNLYMDIQQAINLLIYERFAQEGVEFAYPTQTLYVARASQEPEPPVPH
jgi:small-conductance mechanosensitive channel